MTCEVWNIWLCVGFGKLFWLGCNSVVNFYKVWMYEYFGVGPQVREEVNGIFPRFLRWLPKHRLSMPSRHSLEIWHLVIDNLTTDDVSPSFFFFFFSFFLWYLVMAWSFLILGPVIFQMCLNLGVGCEGYAECEQALELNGQHVLFECGHGRY